MNGEHSPANNLEVHPPDDVVRFNIRRRGFELERSGVDRDVNDLLGSLASLGARRPLGSLPIPTAVDAILAAYDVSEEQAARISELERALDLRAEEDYTGQRLIVVTPSPIEPIERPQAVSEALPQYPDRVAVVGVDFLGQVATVIRSLMVDGDMNDPELRSKARAAAVLLERLEEYYNL